MLVRKIWSDQYINSNSDWIRRKPGPCANLRTQKSGYN